jgi:hypothetical protein
MKILFVPNLIVSSLSDKVAPTSSGGGPGAMVEVKDSASQRRERCRTPTSSSDACIAQLPLAKQIVHYHSIGAGVDNILTTELVNHAVPLASEKGVGMSGRHAPPPPLLTRGLIPPSVLLAELREPIRVYQRELFDTTMGIVGLRGTGRAVASARASECGCLGGHRGRRTGAGVEAIWLRRCRRPSARSGVVVICLPLTKATHHLFTRERFAQMQRHAIIINVTRGEIIRGEDVLAALEEGLIWGAGLDVTDPEPLPKDHALWRHPRAIVTPHTAGGSPRRAGRVIATFCENLRRRRDGRPLLALIDKQKGY